MTRSACGGSSTCHTVMSYLHVTCFIHKNLLLQPSFTRNNHGKYFHLNEEYALPLKMAAEGVETTPVLLDGPQ